RPCPWTASRLRRAISRWAKARATCAIGIGAGGGRITPTARWATAMDRAITATGQAITAMHQATTATDQAGPAACMAAVYTADGGGEASRRSRGPRVRVLTFRRAL